MPSSDPARRTLAQTDDRGGHHSRRTPFCQHGQHGQHRHPAFLLLLLLLKHDLAEEHWPAGHVGKEHEALLVLLTVTVPLSGPSTEMYNCKTIEVQLNSYCSHTSREMSFAKPSMLFATDSSIPVNEVSVSSDVIIPATWGTFWNSPYFSSSGLVF